MRCRCPMTWPEGGPAGRRRRHPGSPVPGRRRRSARTKSAPSNPISGPMSFRTTRADQVRTGGGQAHGEQTAEAGADDHGVMDVERGADIHDVADARLRRIAGDVAATAGLAPARVVDGDDAAAFDDRRGQCLEIRAGADQAGQAQDRWQAVASRPAATVPLADAKGQSVPGRDGVRQRSVGLRRGFHFAAVHFIVVARMAPAPVIARSEATRQSPARCALSRGSPRRFAPRNDRGGAPQVLNQGRTRAFSAKS